MLQNAQMAKNGNANSLGKHECVPHVSTVSAQINFLVVVTNGINTMKTVFAECLCGKVCVL